MTRIKLGVAGDTFEIRIDEDGTAWIRPSKAARVDEDTRIRAAMETYGVPVHYTISVETIEK